MTVLGKRTSFHLLLLHLNVMQNPEITHMKSMGITEVTELRYFQFENYLLLKIN